MAFSFVDAAAKVLEEAGAPLHYQEITKRALAADLIESSGQTPAASMNAVLAVVLKRKGEKSRFVRTAPGIFGLREWLERGDVEAHDVEIEGERVRVPHYPRYSEVRALLPLLEGLAPDQVTGLRSRIVSLTGTPKSQLDWREPDVWIEDRLAGHERELAVRIWSGSNKTVNPRHMLGHWLLANRYDLLTDGSGRLALTDRGQDFIAQPEGSTVAAIDDGEGLLALLGIVQQEGPGSRASLLPAWMEYLQGVSRVRSESYGASTMYARLRNLLDRGLLELQGRNYAITAAGSNWLQRQGSRETPEIDEFEKIRKLNIELRNRVRSDIGEILREMDPYAFEKLVRNLLQAMKYDDVEVTSASNDKGVDVVANIELGITSVREVVQVKRYQGNIQRPVLDALRGSLHRFKAMQGTIITTGGFSKGTREAAFEPGAAPITLIDGQKLVDLLIEHGIGVKKKAIELWEVDPDAFVIDPDDVTAED